MPFPKTWGSHTKIDPNPSDPNDGRLEITDNNDGTATFTHQKMGEPNPSESGIGFVYNDGTGILLVLDRGAGSLVLYSGRITNTQPGPPFHMKGCFCDLSVTLSGGKLVASNSTDSGDWTANSPPPGPVPQDQLKGGKQSKVKER